MTRIIFECSGGMLDRDRDLTVNLGSLPDGEAQTLLHLVRESNFFNIPSNLIRNQDPEKIQYKITVDAGIVYHTVCANENTTPESLRPLLNELSARMGAALFNMMVRNANQETNRR